MGHAAIKDLFADPVVVEEKIDGSQFSFLCLGDTVIFRSKNAVIDPTAAGMFQKGVDAISEIAGRLMDGWTYRGEYLMKPKHNTLAYDRVPRRHVILYDVDTGLESYLPRYNLELEAARIGLDVVPCLAEGNVFSLEELEALLQTPSILGGQTVEGVVIKNHHRFGRDGKALMGKHVSAKFREVHDKDWKKRNPAGKDIIATIVAKYRTEARWTKAVAHMRERGELQDAPQDIGPLFKEVSTDILAECGDEIKDALLKWAWKDISRGVTRGLPDWYKEQLSEQQFSQ